MEMDSLSSDFKFFQVWGFFHIPELLQIFNQVSVWFVFRPYGWGDYPSFLQCWDNWCDFIFRKVDGFECIQYGNEFKWSRSLCSAFLALGSRKISFYNPFYYYAFSFGSGFFSCTLIWCKSSIWQADLCIPIGRQCVFKQKIRFHLVFLSGGICLL